jgi:tetratricopeptide (TPR) repeat protein
MRNSEVSTKVILLLIVLSGLALPLRAQEEGAEEETKFVPKRFNHIYEDPFDQITLKDGNTVILVPYAFPDGLKPQDPKPNDKIRIELFNEVGAKFDVAWKDIQRYDQYQDLILQDGQALTALGQFDLAWDHFVFLRQNYAKTPGLEAAIQDFLFANAGALYAEWTRAPQEIPKLERALALLEELHQSNPRHPRVAGGLGAAAGQLLKIYTEDQKDYRVARQLLQRLDAAYGASIRSTLDTWRSRLIELATVEKNRAEAHVAAGSFLEAHEAVRRMVGIWPDLAGGLELATEIAEKYPLVVVGVEQPVLAFNPQSVDDWAARRSGRLLYRTLTEYERRGLEGGVYRFPLGQYLRTDDDLQLRFRLNPDFLSGPIVLTGYDVARTLASLAHPGDQLYRPAWGQLADEIAVEGVTSVVVELRRPHVRPEAFLQSKFDFLAGDSAGNPFTPYEQVNSSRPNEMQFTRNDAYAFRGAAQPAVVVERRFEREKDAVQALLSGEIDLLDRVYPADVPRLRAQRGLRIDRYDAPTIHMLVPNDRNEFLANRTFRRAILLGTARETILNSILLEGKQIPGCRLVSGPFPAGVGRDDPQAYGYDFRLEPRPWNLQHAFVLKALALTQVEKQFEAKHKKAVEKAEAAGEPPPAEAEPPKLGPLKLVHPATEIARRACQAIQLQLKQIEIEILLEELPPGEVRPEKDDFDLLYAEVCAMEPLVDARRILGEGTVAKITNAYIRQALRDLDAASSWRDARDRLLELHERVHTELTVIPLWQLIDYYAHRPSVQNFAPQPALLYQDIEQWRIVPRPFTQ